MNKYPMGRSIAHDTQRILADVGAAYGTPCFVYFSSIMRRQLEALRAAFGDRLLLSFAVKANPNIEILSWLRTRVDLLDISSEGELHRSLRAGWPAEKLSFTGPGKTERELRAAVEHGIGQLVLESVGEAVVADRIAASCRNGGRQSCLIRIAPAHVPPGLMPMSPGGATPFGIAEEDLTKALPVILNLRNLKIEGFHIYSGSHCLDAEVLLRNYEIFLEVFSRYCEAYQLTPSKLVLGAGIGIPYDEESKPIDLAALGAGLNRHLDSFTSLPRFANSVIVYEMGRFIVGPAGYYLATVSWLKECRGTSYAIVDGGMHHFQSASRHLSVLGKNLRMFKVPTPEAPSPLRLYDIVGPLCTHNDKLARGIRLPDLQEGDLLAIESAGGYGLSLSPTRFISHQEPTEIFIDDSLSCGVRDISESSSSIGPRYTLESPRRSRHR
jgi:diaminopimelate decarboxylase